MHHYRYSKPLKYGSDDMKQKGAPYVWIDSVEELDEPKAFNPVDLNAYRVRRMVKFLVECNAYQYDNGAGGVYQPIFGTFTFRENIRTVVEANPMFRDFMARLNYHLFGKVKMKLKDLVVPEFQPVSGRVHYHGIFFNLPFVENIYDVFEEVWGNGIVNVKSITGGVQHLTNYVAKYITKDKRDERLAGKKKYFCSRGIFRPQEFREAEVIVPFLHRLGLKPDFSKSFENPDSDLVTDYEVFRTDTSYLPEFQQLMWDHFSCNHFTREIERAKSLDVGHIWIPPPRPTAAELFLPAPPKQVQQNFSLPKP